MKFLKIETSGEFKIVKLNRPEVKNAFHPEMIAEITAAFTEFNMDSKIKAVVIAGEGSVFCAGADLNWMQEMIKYSLAENQKDSEKLWQMFEAIQVCERPVIGIVHGAVFGGALGLMACCDYVFAEEKTQFCFSEVKLGLVPAVISSFVLKKVPDAFVRPLMLSAEVRSCLGADMLKAVWSDVAVPPVLTNYERFIAAIKGKTMVDPDFARGAELQKVLDLAAASDAENCRDMAVL